MSQQESLICSCHNLEPKHTQGAAKIVEGGKRLPSADHTRNFVVVNMGVEELEYDLRERLMADSSYKMIDEVSGDPGGQRRHESSSMI